MSKPDNETMQLLQQAKQLDQQGKESECMAMATKLETLAPAQTKYVNFAAGRLAMANHKLERPAGAARRSGSLPAKAAAHIAAFGRMRPRKKPETATLVQSFGQLPATSEFPSSTLKLVGGANGV